MKTLTFILSNQVRLLRKFWEDKRSPFLFLLLTIVLAVISIRITFGPPQLWKLLVKLGAVLLTATSFTWHHKERVRQFWYYRWTPQLLILVASGSWLISFTSVIPVVQIWETLSYATIFVIIANTLSRNSEQIRGFLKIPMNRFLLATIFALLALLVLAFPVDLPPGAKMLGILIFLTYLLIFSSSKSESEPRLRRRRRPSKGSSRPLLITATLAVGLLLRLYSLSTQSFWGDEAITASAGQTLLTEMVPTLPSGQLYLRALLSTFMVSLSFMIYGTNEFAARLPSAFAGWLTIPAVYLLVWRTTKDRTAALIASTLMAFSAYDIAWSRQARMYSQVALFSTLATSYLYTGFVENIRRHQLLSIAFLTIAITLQPLALILAGTMLVGLWRINRISEIIRRSDLKVLFAGVAAVTIVLLSIHASAITAFQQTPSFLSKPIYFYLLFLLNEFPIITGLVIVTIFQIFISEKKDAPGQVFLAVVFILYLLAISLLNWKSARYMIIILPVFYALAGLGLRNLMQTFQSRLRPLTWYAAALTVVFAVSMTVGIVQIWKIQQVLSGRPSEALYDVYVSDWNILKRHIEKDDSGSLVLVSTNTVVPAYYFPKAHRFWLRNDDLDAFITTKSDRKENWSGSEIIKDWSSFRKIIRKYPRGYVVVEKIRSSYVDETVLDYVQVSFNKIPIGDTIMAYRWKTRQF